MIHTDINIWFNKWINGGEETNLIQKNSNAFHIVHPKKGKSYPLFKCGLHILTSFPKVQYGKGGNEQLYSGETWQTSPKPGDQDQHQQWFHVHSTYLWYDVMKSHLCDFSLKNS